MNDPHVHTLHYRIKHARSVNFDDAPPLEHQETGFSVRLEKNYATVVMKEHHSTVEYARAAVEPFLRAWELNATLASATEKFEFIFHNSDVIDRAPASGALHPKGLTVASPIITVPEFCVRPRKYPDPPLGLARDGNVDLMLTCYAMYCDGRSRLGDTSYFCLTVLQHTAGDRTKAVQHFGIAKPVLDKIGRLSSTKGGMQARKAQGAQSAFTDAERIWLEEAIKAIIRRAAEIAFNPTANAKQITMADLPALP